VNAKKKSGKAGLRGGKSGGGNRTAGFLDKGVPRKGKFLKKGGRSAEKERTSFMGSLGGKNSKTSHQKARADKVPPWL